MPSPSTPVRRSLAAAAPPDACATRGDGVVAWSAASAHAGWFAFRLELDRPPASTAALERAFDLWDGLGHPADVDRRAVCWETGLDEPWTPVPARYAPWRHRGWVRAAGATLPAAVQGDVRAATASEALRIARAQAAAEPALGDAHRAELCWLYGGLGDRGADVWAAWAGDRPVAGVLAVPFGADEARLRELWTAPDHRRRGLGAALVAAAIAQWPDRRWSLACADGAEAERIYTRAGFRPASRFTTASTDRYSPSRTASPTGPASVTWP